jgi:hypothetical protein
MTTLRVLLTIARSRRKPPTATNSMPVLQRPAAMAPLILLRLVDDLTEHYASIGRVRQRIVARGD